MDPLCRHKPTPKDHLLYQAAAPSSSLVSIPSGSVRRADLFAPWFVGIRNQLQCNGCTGFGTTAFLEMRWSAKNGRRLMSQERRSPAYAWGRTRLAEGTWPSNVEPQAGGSPEGEVVHYRNGREAKNGDRVVQLSYEGGKIVGVGILFDATPGNDYCNGSIASTLGGPVTGACMCDCLHADDLAALLAEKGLDKRPVTPPAPVGTPSSP